MSAVERPREARPVLVMFDLDNTLADREASVDAWLMEFARAHGLDDETTRWIKDLDNDGYSARAEVFAQIRERLGLAASVDELLEAYQTRVVELAAPTGGAEACLVACRAAGHRIAIVTNGSSRQQHGKIERLGFGLLVDAVVVSGDLGIKKPDHRLFHIAAEQAESTLDGAWMIGDSAVHDIAPAHELGLDTMWIHRGRPWPLDEIASTHVIGSPRDVIGLLA